MRFQSIHLLVMLLNLILLTLCVDAAEIRVYSPSVIILEGNIEKGDYDKVFDATKKIGPTIETFFLVSPGGNLLEAMRIGRLVRKLRWSTEAPEFFKMIVTNGYYGFNNIKESHQIYCASSCFFIYAAGIHRSGDEIGIHRPYLSKDDYIHMTGNDVIHKSKVITSIVGDYLKEMNIPSSFLEIMFSINKDDIRWLSHEELDELNRYIPGLDDWFDSICGSKTKLISEKKKIWFKAGLKTPALWKTEKAFKLVEKLETSWCDCRQNLSHEMRKEAWVEFFGKQ